MNTTIQKAHRIEIVDSLRGFAVFGILISHCYYLFFLGEATNTTATDEGLTHVVRFLVNDKFYSLFSFLFGLSFSLMLSRTNDTASKFYTRFAWRLILLGIIGLLHNLHWNDDILSIYAVLGFILLPISKVNNKIVFAVAVLLLLNVPSFFVNWVQTPMTVEEAAIEQDTATKTYEAFYEAMQHGSYLDTVKANISTYKYKLQFYLYSGRFSFMLGFFFLGLVAGRLKLFHNFADNRKLFKRIFLWTASIALLLTVLALLPTINKGSFSKLNGYLRYFMKSQAILLTFAYISGMTLLFTSSGLTWIAKQFAIIGKMALTNYVLHSVLGTIILCGYGFGLLNHPISVTAATVASIPLFILMILFSHFWLSRFTYGPLEWLWRIGTYLKVLPLKKSNERSAN